MAKQDYIALIYDSSGVYRGELSLLETRRDHARHISKALCTAAGEMFSSSGLSDTVKVLLFEEREGQASVLKSVFWSHSGDPVERL